MADIDIEGGNQSANPVKATANKPVETKSE